MRIELCGPLGVGKTTLARQLSALTGWELVQEPVDTHPFLKAFYRSPQKFSLEADLFFLLNYVHQIKAYGTKDIILDRSFIVSRSYAAFSPLSEAERDVLKALDEALTHLEPPALILNLAYPSALVLERIMQRRRAMVASVDMGFVSALNEEIQRQVRQVEDRVNVLHVDMTRYDFERNPDDAAAVLAQALQKIAEPRHIQQRKIA